MTAGAEGVRAELREAARDAVVRSHHELFRAAQRAVGAVPIAYDDLSERTRRLQHNQLDPQADAAVDAVWAIVGPLLTERDIFAEQLAQAYRAARYAVELGWRPWVRSDKEDDR